MARRRLTPAQPLPTAEVAARTPDMPSVTPMATQRSAPIAQVTGQSAEAAALRELTDRLQAARAGGDMILDVPLGEVSADFLMRERITLDRDELDALKRSIQANGQRTAAEITPLPSDVDTFDFRYGLISGWRRLTALKELYAETGDARFSTLRAVVRPIEDATDSYVAMIEENEVRVGLSYYERARVVAELSRRGVFSDQQTALRTLFASASRAKRSKIGSFVEIVESIGDLLHYPTDLPERLGLALVAQIRAHGAKPMRAALKAAAPESAQAELKCLDLLARPERTPAITAKPAKEQLRPDVMLAVRHTGHKLSLTLNGEGVDEDLVQQLLELVRQLKT